MLLFALKVRYCQCVCCQVIIKYQFVYATLIKSNVKLLSVVSVIALAFILLQHNLFSPLSSVVFSQFIMVT